MHNANNLTFSNPFLNTSNTISLKYDNTKLSVDASGNLTVIGGTSQWTTSGTSIFYNTGNVGIGTVSAGSILQVGNAGRLKIGSGTTDFTLVGTLDTDDNATNTKIFLKVIHVIMQVQQVLFSILQVLEDMYFMLVMLKK